MADDPTEWRAVKPEGLAAAILGVTIIFTVLCIAVVALRVYARVSMQTFGLEDWLMCGGFVSVRQKAGRFGEKLTWKKTINMVHNGIVLWGVFTGIGTYDSKLNPVMMMEAAKVCSISAFAHLHG